MMSESTGDKSEKGGDDGGEKALAVPKHLQKAGGDRAVIIRTRNLRKTYQMGEVTTVALQDIDVELYRGEFVCIMGPSGSGT